mgnify:CR=1 FL=1
MSGFFHSLNFFKSFQKRCERELTGGSLTGKVIFKITLPVFLPLMLL